MNPLVPVLLASLLTQPPAPCRFESVEFEKGLTVGYAVHLCDINHDRKPDIVVVDSHRVLWYENPTWKPRTILRGKTKPDNVCIADLDIDGDGLTDLVLGADWKPFNTRSGGTLHWLKRGKTLEEEWSLFPIGEEPTAHRVRVADLKGDGQPAIVLGPLMGRDSSAKGNWMDGRPVRLLAYPIPADPVRGPWVPEVIDESLHVVHNLWPIPRDPANPRLGFDLLTASYGGVHRFAWHNNAWSKRQLGSGNQDTPTGKRGASEIKLGRLKNGKTYLATIEPWHGDQVVVYTEPTEPGQLWNRHVVDDQLKWGHAVWCADLTGDGNEELIIGVRDTLAEEPGKRCGVRVYYPTAPDGSKFVRQIVEDGGVAVEDLTAADLDGDGRVDLVAVGRRTGNGRIYWNKGR